MNRLMRYVQDLQCPNYWIPEINLFEDLEEIAQTDHLQIKRLNKLLQVVLDAGNVMFTQYLD